MAHLSLDDYLFREQRRRAVIVSTQRVGLDAVVPRHREDAQDAELWDLELRFLPAGRAQLEAGVPPVPAGVSPVNLRITLGDLPDPGVRIESVEKGEDDRTLIARVRRDRRLATGSGDPESAAGQGVYTLELVDLPVVDRFFRRDLFVFKDGGLEIGTLPARRAPDAAPDIPDIDYLAKDFDSFRQLMLEELKVFVPSWQEQHAADLGVTVVELLAHAADYLSYYQDAVATEAYIATARRRISVRRHARLADYVLHEGCNARCWVQLKLETAPADGQCQTVSVDAEGDQDASRAGATAADPDPAATATSFLELGKGVGVLTYSGRLPGSIVRGTREHRRALEQEPLIFHTVQAETLYPDHNKLPIYDWKTESFTLTAGTTRAALRGGFKHMRAGDVLIFERRGAIVDADQVHGVDPRDRQAVRLCRPPILTEDLAPRSGGEAVEITEIEWFAEDALKVDYPVTTRSGGTILRDLTVVRGNVVLVDHGVIHHEVLEPVPAEGRYAPRLVRRGLTHRVPYDPQAARRSPAAGALLQDPRQALPDVELFELRPEELERDGSDLEPEALRESHRHCWHARQDLLASGRFAHDFVVELDGEGTAHLRFGDDHFGRRPSPGTVFVAVYRIGLGPAGNVGPYAIRHLVMPPELKELCADLALRLVEAKNHLPGGGGLDREPVEKARLFAPEALQSRASLQRCVTADDYAEIAERHPDVLRAAARLKWNGSWNLAELFAQRPGQRPVDELFERRLRRFMEPYLLAGWQLEISSPSFVPLFIHLRVIPEHSVEPDHLQRVSDERVAAGDLDLLRPDRFTFGEPVLLSGVIAELMAWPEVANVETVSFQCWGQPPRGELEAGEIRIQPLEIAQLENDPASPHRGVLLLEAGEDS